MEASITLKSVGKTIGKNILLADLSFGVEKGSTFVLIGENGSGKSIILRLLVGLIEKDTGSLYIHGKDVSTRSISTRSICGYMPQVVNLDDEVTVKENLIIYGKLHGLKNNRIIKNIKHWSEVLGFSEYLNYLPYDLSYGYQKLVLFARCLIHEPEVLLLDEPTSGMDPGSRNRLWNVIDKIYKDKTIIFASQNFTEAERYSDRIAILHNGNIKMDGNLEKLIESTHGLTRYSITFSESISEEFMNQLKSFPRVKNPKLKGLELEFYSRERKQFFNVLKLAIDYGLSDLDTSICSLRDLYLGLTEGGLE
tara:strand:- start:763 stop:1689 length:927 start_codon:yes stop_codon:yes gene_type:complete